MKTLARTTKSGVALYISILVAALILSIGLSIGNIYVKETNLSISSRESQIAFYAADSGLECAQYWDKIVGGSYFASTTDSTFVNQMQPFNCAGVTYNQPAAQPFPVSSVITVPDPTDSPNVLVYTVDTPYSYPALSSTVCGGVPCAVHPLVSDAAFGGTPGSLDSLTMFKVFFDFDGNGATASDPCAILSIRKVLSLVTPTDPDRDGGSGGGEDGVINDGFYYNTIIESRGYNTCSLTSTKRVERAIRVQ
jgi:hypothetical protein